MGDGIKSDTRVGSQNVSPQPAALNPVGFRLSESTGERAAATGHFILELARSLHRHGMPAHELETALSQAAQQLQLEASFFSTPTSIMVGIGPIDRQQVHLIRVEPGEPDLGNLATLGEIVHLVTTGAISTREGLSRINALSKAAPIYPVWLQLLAFVLASAAVASFLQVRRGDLAVASLLGLVTALVAIAAGSRESTRHVTEPLAAFTVTTIAFALDALLGTNTGYATSLAGLVIMLPGLTVTVALTELSTRHLSSGTARLSGAFVTFLGLGFGLALGAKTGAKLGGSLTHWLPELQGLSSRSPLPSWSSWLALIIAPLAFTVLLKARRRDALPIVIAGAAAYLTSKYAGGAMGEELGAFLGAMVVSAGSNIFARLRHQVAMVTQVPGLLILVPGSIGFRSVTSLLGQEVETGIATAFRVAIIGISLAAGLLAGNVVTQALSHAVDRDNNDDLSDNLNDEDSSDNNPAAQVQITDGIGRETSATAGIQ